MKKITRFKRIFAVMLCFVMMLGIASVSVSAAKEMFTTYQIDDVTITASDSNSQTLLNKLLPYDIQNIHAYDKTFLSGFMAHKTEKTVNEGWNEAKQTIDDKLRSLILSNYHYNVVKYLNVNTIHENVTYKYVLLPIYVVSFPYKKKSYPIYVNGNTGKVSGKTPVSPWKVGIVSVLSAALLALIIWLFYTYGLN